MTAHKGNISATGELANNSNGTMIAGQDITSGKHIGTGSGTMTAGGSITAQGRIKLNPHPKYQTAITAGGSITATTDSIFVGKGTSLIAETGDISAGTMIGASGLLKGDSITAANGDITVREGGSITAKTDITATNGALTVNEGSTVTAETGSITAQAVTAQKGTALTAGKDITATTGSLTANEGSTVKATTGSITAQSVTAEKNTTLTAADSLNITGTAGDTPILQLDETTTLATGKITVPKDATESRITAPGLSLALPGDGAGAEAPGILYPTPAEGEQATAPKFEGGKWTQVPPVITDAQPTTFDKAWNTAHTGAVIRYHIGDVLYGWFAAIDPATDKAYGSVSIAKAGSDTFVTVDPAAYTVSEGSLIIDLTPAKLPNGYKSSGSYTVKIHHSHGDKAFPLTITQPSAPAGGSGSAPAKPLAAATGYQTGDSTNTALPIGLALLCFAGMAVTGARLAKGKKGKEN